MEHHTREQFIGLMDSPNATALRVEHTHMRPNGVGVICDVYSDSGHSSNSIVGPQVVTLTFNSYLDAEQFARELFNTATDGRSRDTQTHWPNATDEMPDSPAVPDVPIAAQVMALDVNGQVVSVQDWLLQLSEAITDLQHNA